MKNYVIITDSSCDLDKSLREKYGLDYVEMRITYDNIDVPASLDWEYIPAKEFYGLMRNGTRITTSQATADAYREKFEHYIKEGYDILSLSCSSALSSSVNGSYIARDDLKEIYPESKIICIDALNSCYGLGLMAITASEMRNEGKTIEETAEWIESHKQEVNQLATVEDLNYLKRAGRVTAASAVFGGLLQIKPIIISDTAGQNVPVEKVRGRRTSINRIISLFTENYLPNKYQKIFIGHADCLEEAEALKKEVYEALPDKNVEIYIGYIGPIIGASVGPGTLGLYFFGKEVTFRADKK